jgi:hypothetical protein
MNANQTPCQGVTGFLFGHKFRARYDTQEIPHFSPQSVELAKRPDLGDLIKASQDGLQESEDILEVIESYAQTNQPSNPTILT